MGSSAERASGSGKPSARAMAHVLDNARSWAPAGAALSPATRLGDLPGSLRDHWEVLLIGAGLDEFAAYDVERPPETLEDVACAYDLWAAASAAAANEVPSAAAALSPDFGDELLALERTRAHPRIVGADYGVWDRATPVIAIWWCNAAADVAMVFRATGGHHAAATLASIVRGAMSEPPASSLIERARWPVERAHEAALAARNPAFVAHGSMVCVATREERAAIAHVGGARAMRARGDGGEWLTEDHVLGGDGPFASRLARAVGERDGFDIETREIVREVGDRLVLCTSEVSRAYAPDELAQLVATLGREAPGEIVRALSARAPEGTSAIALVT